MLPVDVRDDSAVFLTIKWSMADLRAAMEKQGIPDTEENINLFFQNGGISTLEDNSVTEGWSSIEDTLSILFNNGDDE